MGDKEKGLLGQILKTLVVAHRENPNIVVFGTGASEKNGLKESEYTIKYMFDNFQEIKEFPQFQNIDAEQLRRFMDSHSIPEKKSQNTYEEIKKAVEIFSYYGIEKMILISNPDHVSRCMQLAHQVYQETKSRILENLFAAQSEVGYNGTSQITSRIVELPHRGDDLSPDLSRYIGDYFKLPLEKKKEFVEQVKKFFE